MAGAGAGRVNRVQRVDVETDISLAVADHAPVEARVRKLTGVAAGEDVADVVIVGYGGAGVCAGIEAARAGAAARP